MCLGIQHIQSEYVWTVAFKFLFDFHTGDGDCFVHLPTFVDPCHLEHHYLSEVGVSAAKKLLSVIAHERPDIVYCPLLFGMTCLLLHYMEEQECYDCINYLISSKEKHLAQTKTAYEASALVLKELTKKYAVSIYLLIAVYSLFVGLLITATECSDFFLMLKF